MEEYLPLALVGGKGGTPQPRVWTPDSQPASRPPESVPADPAGASGQSAGATAVPAAVSHGPGRESPQRKYAVMVMAHALHYAVHYSVQYSVQYREAQAADSVPPEPDHGSAGSVPDAPAEQSGPPSGAGDNLSLNMV